MNYFSMPADFKKETIRAYSELNKKYSNSRISEIYGNITVGNMFQSGRSVDLLPKVSLSELADHIKFSKDFNIEFNYTFNATSLQNQEFTKLGIKNIITFLNKLRECGVRKVTVALPSLIELIKSTGLDFEIKGSTLCQITNASKALGFKNMGVERIVVDESVNRNFKALKSIRENFGEKVELIVNAICHKNCAYRIFHYNQMSCDSIHVTSKASSDYYSHRCILQRFESLGTLFKLSWIRPEDIVYYSNIGINYFKLQGRQAVIKGDPLKAVESYMKGYYKGDLFELLDMFSPTSKFRVMVKNESLDEFIKPYYNNKLTCTNDCHNCNYCESFAKKILDKEDSCSVMEQAKDFYKNYDEYSYYLNEVRKQRNIYREVKNEVSVDFNLDI